MSSGIHAAPELLTAFSEAQTGESIRALKIQIKDDAMSVVEKLAPTGSAWEEDIDSTSSWLSKNEACIVLVRTDEHLGAGWKWVMFAYVPDTCKVREKMLYASSHAQLKLDLGSGAFVHDIFCNAMSDVSKAGFEAYLIHANSDAPLTESEAQRLEEIMNQDMDIDATGSVSVEEGTAATQIVHGVAFEAESGVAEAVAAILDPSSSENYVRLSLDQTTEKITLADKKNITDLAELGPQCPMNMPAFHLFRYSHEHEGKHYDSVIFIYSCPDGSGKTKSAPIKARMTYSSCKSAVEALVTGAGKTVDVRLEINDGEHDLEPQDIKNAVHPPPIVKKAAFAKPKPKGKGPRRLTKVQE